MLTQQSEKELQQFDEQIRFERDTLEARLLMIEENGQEHGKKCKKHEINNLDNN